MTPTQHQPLTEIRSDLWTTLAPSELSNQLDLVISRIGAIYASGMASHPSYIGVLKALETAQQDLTELLSK